MQISDHYQIAECMYWIPRPWIVGSPGGFFDPRDSKRVPTMQALKGEKILQKQEPMLRYNQTIQNMIKPPTKKVLCHKK